jgi:fumarate reductase subunit C
VREISSEWIFRHPRYVRYLVREFSCLFIGGYALLMVVALMRLSQGPAAWEGFLQALQAPASIAFHLVALAFSLYHSVTWFNLTPKALPVQLGEKFLPDGVIAGAHYAGWFALSVALFWMAGVF